MAGPNPTDLEHERALAKLRSAAVQLGLAYEVLEGIATAPALQQLPSNKQRRFHVYQAVAHALGVVSLPLTHAGCVPGRFAGLKSLQWVCRWVMETAPNSGPTWRRRYGCSTRTQQALPKWASGPRPLAFSDGAAVLRKPTYMQACCGRQPAPALRLPLGGTPPCQHGGAGARCQHVLHPPPGPSISLLSAEPEHCSGCLCPIECQKCLRLSRK
jgi:hypothetical protein